MKQLNIGIIGYGFMGRTHAFAYKSLPAYYENLPFKVSLKAVCTSRSETALAAKNEMDFEYCTTNQDDIINDESIDIINICTPNVYHKDTLIKAIKNNKHIYCDKPLTVSYSEAKEVLTELEKKNIVCQVALQNRFFPATLRAKQLIEDGRLGNILSFRCFYLHSGSVDKDKPIGWKQDKSFGGGGVLFDLGSHAIDLMYYLLGEFSEIFCHTNILYKKRPDKGGNLIDITSEDIAYLILKLGSGGTGTVEVSKIATGANDELKFEIHGDKGSIRFNLMDPNWLEFYDNTVSDKPYGGFKGYTKIECVQRYEKPGGFPGPKFSVGWIRGHIHSLYNFADTVYNFPDKKASPSFYEAAYVQYIMEKAYEADKQKGWIAL